MNNQNLIGDNTLQWLVSVLNGSKFHEDETINYNNNNNSNKQLNVHM